MENERWGWSWDKRVKQRQRLGAGVASIRCVLVSPWRLSAKASPSLLAAEELLGSECVMGDGVGKKHGECVREGCFPGQDSRAVGCRLLLCLGDGRRHSGCGDAQQELLALQKAARAWGLRRGRAQAWGHLSFPTRPGSAVEKTPMRSSSRCRGAAGAAVWSVGLLSQLSGIWEVLRGGRCVSGTLLPR